MKRDHLSALLFLAALRAVRGWDPMHVMPAVLECPGVYRPVARA